MGAVYAESLIRAATDDNLCVDPESKSFTKRQTVTGAGPQFECGEDAIPAADIRKNQNLYDALIDTFSMRGFVPSSASSGHDHFFNAFMKFGGTDPRHEDEWVDEVATRAAEQNEQYLELMVTPTWNRLNFITKNVSWNDDLNELREELLAKGLRDDVPAAQRSYDQAEASRRQREHCGEPGEVPACKVQTRYIYQVYRNNPKELVFAQALLGCEIASSDPRVVAINFVQAEDDYTSMSDYAL